jgi:HprK-related kinase A
MATVSSLSPAALRRRLAGPGIHLETGSFVTLLRSPIARVADTIGLLYADYPLREGAGFADFHVELAASGGLRRLFARQALFRHDGTLPFQPLPLAHAFPLFEWAMNWCVSSRAHEYLIIHAAVLERHGVAVILPAPPGSGKSTLCAALACRGWRLLSDELALVRLTDGLIVPLPRPVSLKNGAIDVIRAFAPDAVISPPVANTNKGTVAHVKAPAASVARAREPARAAHIVFPAWAAGAAPLLEPIAPARAFMQVAENCFNYGLLAEAGFTALARLIDGCASYRFSYGKLDDAVALFSDLAGPAPGTSP